MGKVSIGASLLLCGAITAWGASVKPLQVPLKDASGADVGTVTFSKGSKAVDVKVALKGLPAGEHGIHVHQGTSCTPPDFQSAAGHLNPTSKHHGFDNPEGHHAGDFPMSVKVAADGKGKATFHSSDLSFDPASPASILGKTVVVHELVDDQKTDPAGASGKRIACGVIPAM